MDWLFTDETAATLIVVIGVGLLAIARTIAGRLFRYAAFPSARNP
jgi:hypothetical protein